MIGISYMYVLQISAWVILHYRSMNATIMSCSWVVVCVYLCVDRYGWFDLSSGVLVSVYHKGIIIRLRNMCLRRNFRIYRSSSRFIQTGQEHRLYDVKKLTSYSSVPQITLCNLISMNSKITAKQSPWPLFRHEVVKSDVVYKWW